jgi:hypothetical protein
VTFYGWYVADLVQRTVAANSPIPDESRTFGVVQHARQRGCYLLEATVPKGAPAPGLFQQSLISSTTRRAK